MLIFPAIDIQDGRPVRLYQGDFSTAEQVAEDAEQTAAAFCAAGASWLHMVDLDGARTGSRQNAALIGRIAQISGLSVQLGGGIRTMDTLEYYLSRGVARCILGSAALKNPAFVKEAVRAYGHRIAVGIDARDGRVAAEGWMEQSDVDYLTFARQMEQLGVQTLIFTDIGRDGTLTGPNVEQLKALSQATGCQIIASGGVRDMGSIRDCAELGLYGTICGKSLYSGLLSLTEALTAQTAEDTRPLAAYFEKSSLIPAVVQEAATGEVLMLAYMNEASLRRTLQSGTTWFWSRSRREFWNKGATSGHMQRVTAVYGDCDRDTLLVQVEQAGAACHTGAHSCFFRNMKEES